MARCATRVRGLALICFVSLVFSQLGSRWSHSQAKSLPQTLLNRRYFAVCDLFSCLFLSCVPLRRISLDSPWPNPFLNNFLRCSVSDFGQLKRAVRSAACWCVSAHLLKGKRGRIDWFSKVHPDQVFRTVAACCDWNTEGPNTDSKVHDTSARKFFQAGTPCHRTPWGLRGGAPRGW